MSALATASLAQRELVRFLRQRSRVTGALATPLVFWLALGAGLGRSFRPIGAPEGTSALAFLFPGTVLLMVLFTAIFATISLIEDRQSGFLQSVRVAPIPSWSLVLGNVLGGTTLAVGQGALLLLLAPLTGVHLGWVGALTTLAMLALVAFALGALGFAIAWRVDSTAGYHAVMNLLLMPMWMLSGALFPVQGAAGWMQVLMTLNPMTYALAAVRHCMATGAAAAALDGMPQLGISVIVTALAAVLAILAAMHAVGRTTRRQAI
jgi:ABC-2 type transport system permease protein